MSHIAKLSKFRVGFGFILIIAAVSLELVPGTSAGIGPIQWGIIVLGALISLSPLIRLQGLSANIILSILSLIIALGIIEAILAIQNFPIAYAENPVPYIIEDLFLCDSELGCRIDAEGARSYCQQQRWNFSSDLRICHVNDAGFYDSDSFTNENLPTDSYRILILGDSFTWGAAAEFGYSWVEYLEQEFAEESVVIWNTGIQSTGTNQHLRIAAELTSVMDADLIILAFYIGNDFWDNLYPVGSMKFVSPDNGADSPIGVRSTQRLSDGSFRETTDAELYYYAAGFPDVLTGLTALVARTRLGTFLIKSLSQSGRFQTPESDFQESIELTENYINEIKILTEENEAQLLVLLIPFWEDLAQADEKYLAARNLLERQEIPFIEVRDSLTIDNYYTLPSNNHWNSDGHQIIGRIMTDCIHSIQLNDNDGTCFINQPER